MVGQFLTPDQAARSNPAGHATGYIRGSPAIFGEKTPRPRIAEHDDHHGTGPVSDANVRDDEW